MRTEVELLFCMAFECLGKLLGSLDVFRDCEFYLFCFLHLRVNVDANAAGVSPEADSQTDRAVASV